MNMVQKVFAAALLFAANLTGSASAQAIPVEPVAINPVAELLAPASGVFAASHTGKHVPQAQISINQTGVGSRYRGSIQTHAVDGSQVWYDFAGNFIPSTVTEVVAGRHIGYLEAELSYRPDGQTSERIDAYGTIRIDFHSPLSATVKVSYPGVHPAEAAGIAYALPGAHPLCENCNSGGGALPNVVFAGGSELTGAWLIQHRRLGDAVGEEAGIAVGIFEHVPIGTGSGMGGSISPIAVFADIPAASMIQYRLHCADGICLKTRNVLLGGACGVDRHCEVFAFWNRHTQQGYVQAMYKPVESSKWRVIPNGVKMAFAKADQGHAAAIAGVGHVVEDQDQVHAIRLLGHDVHRGLFPRMHHLLPAPAGKPQ